jgi:hypothetical protein
MLRSHRTLGSGGLWLFESRGPHKDTSRCNDYAYHVETMWRVSATVLTLRRGARRGGGHRTPEMRTVEAGLSTRPRACPRDAPEPPSTANDHHQQQPVNPKLARALNSASNARDMLVMRRSAVFGWKCRCPPPNPP